MIIIYKEEKNSKLEFTKKELENIIEQARKEGYNEGYKDGFRSYSSITATATTTTPKIDWNRVTCTGTHNEVE